MADILLSSLKSALARLRDSRHLGGAVEHLARAADSINDDLKRKVLAEIPAFSQTANPDILPELARHGPQHTAEILRLIQGGRFGDFDFVSSHARRRAEQRFPLEATLHAYRCGHKVISRWVREAALATVTSPEDAQQVVTAVADFTMEYTDVISTVAASAYVTHTRLLAEVAGDRRAQLLTILLEGYDEADGRASKILSDAGYLHRRQAFCVVLAQPVDPAEMNHPDRARRLADAIDTELSTLPARRLIDVRRGKVTVVLSAARRASGWTMPAKALADRVTATLLTVGNAVLIGISNDVPSTSQIPVAHREAELALELASVSERVVQIAAVPVQRVILHLASEEYQRVLPAWSGAFFTADRKLRNALITTLRAYADANMNVLKAAERLAVHPNTIYARFQKIQDITGIDPRTYHALTELLIIADCANAA